MGLRRKARELSVQTLYALDFAEADNEFREFSLLNAYPEVLQKIAEVEKVSADNPAFSFADELIRSTIINLEDIEKRISAHSENWSIERIVNLDHNILRVAVYELLYTDTPAAVVINEAIEIAKKFSSESSGRFVNGILDAIHQELDFAERRPL